jgi:ketosteroid isomerase-like protein
MSGDRGERLDELNRKTVREYWRPIMDRGIGAGEGSALPGLLAALRENAEQVFSETPAPSRAKRT